MFRNIVIVALFLIVWTGLPQGVSPQEDVEGTLSRAEALYYEARFKDSVDLLLPVDAKLGQQPDQVRQKVRVKVQLALGYIGQNQTAQAKSVFQEVCVLDDGYSLDAGEFSPKVLSLFNDAKAEHKKARCDAFCEEVARHSSSANTQELLRLAREVAAGCTCEAAAGAAELLYTQGVEAYKREDYGQAMEKFRAALKFRPQHDLALQYSELTESKAKLTVDQKFLEWRKTFDAQEFPKAAGLYRQLESLNIEGKADAALTQMRGEYRRVAASRVESWNQSCAAGAAPSRETFNQQTRDLLPDETMAAEVTSKLSPCEPPTPAKPPVQRAEAPVPPPTPTAAPGCLEMPSTIALARIKSQVSPNIRIERLPAEPLNLRAKVRIDENGNVAVKEVSGGSAYINEAMREAIERWKFLPATVGDQRRCVETELPVLLKR